MIKHSTQRSFAKILNDRSKTVNRTEKFLKVKIKSYCFNFFLNVAIFKNLLKTVTKFFYSSSTYWKQNMNLFPAGTPFKKKSNVDVIYS